MFAMDPERAQKNHPTDRNAPAPLGTPDSARQIAVHPLSSFPSKKIGLCGRVAEYVRYPTQAISAHFSALMLTATKIPFPILTHPWLQSRRDGTTGSDCRRRNLPLAG